MVIIMSLINMIYNEVFFFNKKKVILINLIFLRYIECVNKMQNMDFIKLEINILFNFQIIVFCFKCIYCFEIIIVWILRLVQRIYIIECYWILLLVILVMVVKQQVIIFDGRCILESIVVCFFSKIVMFCKILFIWNKMD